MQVIKYAATAPIMPETVRVAAYARVSSDKDTAEHSLDAQISYYENYVSDHVGWKLVKVYYDEGISGTKINRPAFQQMLEDCRQGKIDRIITKTISRFARNTVILISTIRELKNLGIEVIFENEHLSSSSGETELLLTLLGIFAEEEARSNSQNQLWKIKKRFEQGQTTIGRMLGYRLKDGVLTIVPEEAEIVRIIYQLYLNGYGRNRIAKELNKLGIKPVYSDKWQESPIRKILTNEKYSGDMLLQKTYTEDFRTKKAKVNHGERPQYYVENSHEAIIDKDTFVRVQEMMNERARNHKNIPYENRVLHLFTGFVKCGICGYHFRYKNTNFKYKPHDIWICSSFNYLGKDFCPAKQIREEILIEKTKEVLHMEKEENLTRDILKDKVDFIIANPNNELLYHLKDGSIVTIYWENKSRRDSWTPEMKEEARKRTLEQHRRQEKEEENATSTKC